MRDLTRNNKFVIEIPIFDGWVNKLVGKELILCYWGYGGKLWYIPEESKYHDEVEFVWENKEYRIVVIEVSEKMIRYRLIEENIECALYPEDFTGNRKYDFCLIEI